jgi:starch synthase
MYLAEARALAPHESVARSVLTIHNIAFQGVFPMHTADMLGVPAIWRGMDGVEFWGQLSMLKAGVQFADAVTTVSPTYAREIQTEAFGVGMDGVLRAQQRKLSGILNGIDTNVWNPEKDKLVPHNYSAAYPGATAQDKALLQQRCGLAQDSKAMLFGVVSRLTPQKGIDLVLGSLDAILESDSQLVVLGQGDPGLQNALMEAAQRFPRQVSVTVGFSEEQAHLIEAGADCFLMPSRFEPCGLNQMYSQAYGTPPVVGNVGGLADSVTDATSDPAHGTGFVMRSPNPDGFREALSRAIKAYREPMRWRRIMANGMARHFGWEESAAQYVELYERVLGRTPTSSAQAPASGTRTLLP